MRIVTTQRPLTSLAIAAGFVLSTFLLPPGTAFAQGKGGAMAKSAMMPHDQKFLRDTAQGGMAEVELGKLAVQRASNSEVKAFGQRMIDDHSKANDKLKALADSKSISLPKEVSAEQKAMRDKLATKSGAEFDHHYMKAMMEDHKKVAAAFEKESTDAKDADVKSFATTTLPTIKEHLKMAQDWVAKMGSK
jgi:putative membrane protein